MGRFDRHRCSLPVLLFFGLRNLFVAADFGGGVENVGLGEEFEEVPLAVFFGYGG